MIFTRSCTKRSHCLIHLYECTKSRCGTKKESGSFPLSDTCAKIVSKEITPQQCIVYQRKYTWRNGLNVALASSFVRLYTAMKIGGAISVKETVQHGKQTIHTNFKK